MEKWPYLSGAKASVYLPTTGRYGKASAVTRMISGLAYGFHWILTVIDMMFVLTAKNV